MNTADSEKPPMTPAKHFAIEYVHIIVSSGPVYATVGVTVHMTPDPVGDKLVHVPPYETTRGNAYAGLLSSA